MNKNFYIIILLKPQFEVEKKYVKKGVVKEKNIHKLLLLNLKEYFNSLNLKMTGLTYSPIKGPKGNIEFLCLLQENGNEVLSEEIEKIVEEAHQNLNLKNNLKQDD